MRYHVLRFDVWLCLAIGVLVSFGTGYLSTIFLTSQYEKYQQEHVVDTREVGGFADDTIFRAQNIEDLFRHEVFTVVSPGIEYRNKGSGYYKNFYMYALTLPSGEVVAARINSDSVTFTGDSIYTGDNILPVGKVVFCDLTDSPTFLSQIEYSRSLTRTDFYIDMVGDASILSEESFIETPVIFIKLFTILFVFFLVHWLGVKFSIFPGLFS